MSFGFGITVGTVTVDSATKLTAVISVSTTATTGARTVTVTAPDARVATLPNGFTVDAAPTITSVSPSSARRDGQPHSVTITGTGFQTGAVLTFSGTGITIGTSGTSNATTYTATITVATTAATGGRNVTITNPDGGPATRTNGLTITT